MTKETINKTLAYFWKKKNILTNFKEENLYFANFQV